MEKKKKKKKEKERKFFHSFFLSFFASFFQESPNKRKQEEKKADVIRKRFFKNSGTIETFLCGFKNISSDGSLTSRRTDRGTKRDVFCEPQDLSVMDFC